MKKIIAAILCVAMLLPVLAGCGGSMEEPEEPPPVEETNGTYNEYPPDDPTVWPSDWGLPDMNAAFAAFAPDTVMITAGDFTVTWGELFFYLRAELTSMGGGLMPDLMDEVVSRFAIQNVADIVLTYRAVEHGARLHGVELSAEDIDIIRQMITGEDVETLRQFGLYSMELYEYIMQTSHLAQLLFEEMYGPEGSGLSDEAAFALTESDEYLMAMHILVMREDGDEGEAQAEAEEMLARLQNYDGDDFTAYFAELMFEYSADQGGLLSYPNGYLFQWGNMVPEFYAGTRALEIGGLSGLIGTTFGYHIIHRLPIDYDEIPFSYFQQHHMVTLRHSAAMMSFELDLQNWASGLDARFSAEYEQIDLVEIFW